MVVPFVNIQHCSLCVCVCVCVSCRYFSSLILVEGMDIDFLHKCALEDRTEQHQFSSSPVICKVRTTHGHTYSQEVNCTRQPG